MGGTVVMSPSTMPELSWMTLARGAKQLVVQEALLKRERQVRGKQTLYRRHQPTSPHSLCQAHLTIFMELSYLSWFTPITNIGASAEGAEMMTLLAPPFK